jgi:hypothetical protein
LQDHGCHIRNSVQVAGTPERYRSYIQQSRGDFSCAKPSCRTPGSAIGRFCHLASGGPVVVQHTGPSAVLPNGLGVFRFSTIEEAVEALAPANDDYPRHRRAARELAESF